MERKFKSEPTHFIEVWKWERQRKIMVSKAKGIFILPHALAATEAMDDSTIAIFKITPKQQ